MSLILLGIQKGFGLIRREEAWLGICMAAIDEHIRLSMALIYGAQVDVTYPRVRVDWIERRLGLNEAEH